MADAESFAMHLQILTGTMRSYARSVGLLMRHIPKDAILFQVPPDRLATRPGGSRSCPNWHHQNASLHSST